MFEHMAFKGTETIGTKNWPAEKKALDAMETVYDQLEAERNKGPRADPAKLTRWRRSCKTRSTAPTAYVEAERVYAHHRRERRRRHEREHGEDSTEYFYSLPSNRIELWFLLESQRFLHPVFREFYKERDVVMEERRMRVESNPQGN